MTDPEISEQLQAIQKGLRRSGRVMVLSSTQAFIRGALVLVGCGVSYPLIGRPWWQMNALWGLLALAALGTELFLYFRLAARNPDKFVTGMERQMLKYITLVVGIGGAISLALLRRDQCELAPGVWMLLVGAAYVAVGLFSFSDAWVLGLVACAAGAGALFLQPTDSFMLLGLSLGVGSLVWGAVLKVRERRSRDEDARI